MEMTLQEMEALLQMARKYGCSSIGYNSFYAQLPKQETPSNTDPFTPEFLKQPLAGENAPTDDDMLFWSSPHSPDFQSKPPTENE